MTRRPLAHGHRGCRGLLPENTVPAFIKATELGCDFLELDVVISGDGKVVVSHEPWMEHRICLQPNGERITKENERSFNIHRMTLAETQSFDCGSLPHPLFPDQRQHVSFKPELRAVVDAVHGFADERGMARPAFNIEIKSDPQLYGEMQPPPAELAAIVMKEIDDLGITRTCLVQSFDPAVLNALRAIAPRVTIAFLVENARPVDSNLAHLSFKPSVYSPHYSTVDEAVVTEARSRNLGIAVWTVNERDDMQRMIALGVDAIITDYPDRLLALLNEQVDHK
ncbi:MAG TPA: glycerophosphodiester phosphodiesterase family protein [Flavobacteriales bacterium]|nr:glycerophosphodiester phosphodiesterase family protein [Flavobacteriales bacterium]